MAGLPRQLDDDLIWAEYFAPARPAPALFLDRDGVMVEEVHYLHRAEDVRIIPGTVETIRWARNRGWHVVVVTNQAGIGRGRFTWPDYVAVHEHILALLESADAMVDAILACPFISDGVEPFSHPDHPCRKPNPGMLLKAAAELDIDLANSWIVGDKTADLEAGRNAGLAGGILVATGYGAAERERIGHLENVLTAASVADVPNILL